LELCSRFSFNPDEFKRFEELTMDFEVNVNCFDSNRRSPIILLTRHCKSERLVEYIETLLRRHCTDLTWQDCDGWDALISACYFYHNQHLVRVVRLLLSHGIDGKAVTRRGSNALFALCTVHTGEVPNVTDVVRALLDGGVEINGEKSALLAWCRHNVRVQHFLPVVSLMIERGIDLSCKDENNRNALLLICSQHPNGLGLLKVVRLLVDKKIDIPCRDNDGLNVLEILSKRTVKIDDPIIQLLKIAMINIV